MFNRNQLVTAAFLVGVVFSRTPALNAQSLDSLMIRYEALLVARDAAQRDVAVADSVARYGLVVDTVQVGPINIIATAQHGVAAQSFVRTAWEEMASRIGGPGSFRNVDDIWFAYDVDDEPTPNRSNGGYALARIYRANGENIVARVNADTENESATARDTRRAMRFLAYSYLPDEVRTWAGDRQVFERFVGADDTTPRSVLEELAPERPFRRIFATTPYRSARDCYAGNIDQCANALGLDLANHDAWYEGNELTQRLTRGGTNADGCAPLSCQEALAESVVPGNFQRYALVPLSPSLRTNLLTFAIRTGGVGAFNRLITTNSSTSVSDALAATAGMPIENLLAAWQSEVSGSVIRRGTRPQQQAATTIIWVIVLSAMALRSTRWRLN